MKLHACNQIGYNTCTYHRNGIIYTFTGNGDLDISELVDNYHILVQHSVHGEELLDAFNKFDTNKDGFLNLPELKVCCPCVRAVVFKCEMYKLMLFSTRRILACLLYTLP